MEACWQVNAKIHISLFPPPPTSNMCIFAFTCQRAPVVCPDRAQVPQVSLVSDEHDAHRLVSVLADLLQPLVEVLETLLLGDVEHDQSPDSPPVVPRQMGGGGRGLIINFNFI